MKKNLFKSLKEFGLCYTTKYVWNRMLFKLTKRHKYQDKYFDLVLKYLDKNYGQVLVNSFDEKTVIPKDYKVWVFWWQGVGDKQPLLVRKCVESIKTNFKNHEVVVITEENFQDYMSIPDYILEKVKNKTITLTHFSDIIRAILLSEYGGVYLDATCLLIDSIEDEIEGKSFYTNKLQYEDDWMHGFVGKARWSSFFMAGGGKRNPIFVNLKNVLFEYWKTHNYLIDYFLVDYCIMLSYMKFDNLKKMIDDVPYNNPNLHKLSPKMLKKFDKNVWNNLEKDTKVFKLSYKMNFENREEDSFYDYIINKS